MDAVKLLTIDCWREVLKRVTNPKDLMACSETCLLFEALLWKKKNAFLFELVLPIIFRYLPEIVQVPGEAGDNEDIEPEEEEDWKALFDCRAVCKDWCKSVNRFAETEYSERQIFEYWFENGDTTERFLNMFATHVGNPFIGRRVAIEHRSTVLLAPPKEDEPNDGVPQAEIFHISKIRQLLSRFGKEIWALKLFEDMGDQLALCKNMQTILSQLPNLRELRVSNLFLTVEQVDLDELTAYIADNPLPALPYLESAYMPNLNPVMVGLILQKYMSQLKSLTISLDQTSVPEELRSFSRLTELHLNFLDASLSLQRLRQLHSPLKELSLMITENRNELMLWPIDELFRNIQHLPIWKLDIYLDADVFLGESAPILPEFRPRNEFIGAIGISCTSDSFSLNFLAYCPNLVSLEYNHYPSEENLFLGHPDGVPESFDVTGLIRENRFDDMYQSQIWEMIPSLQFLSLWDIPAVAQDGQRFIVYYRKTYEQQKLQK